MAGSGRNYCLWLLLRFFEGLPPLQGRGFGFELRGAGIVQAVFGANCQLNTGIHG